MSTGIRTFTLPEWEAILGRDDLERLIESFSCPVNAEVENFLKTKAFQSSRLSASQTYLVCNDRTGLLLGYFTLLLKTYTVKAASLSSTNRRLISRFAEEDAAGNFNAAVYLIAQIGKNFAIAKENQIKGCDLLARAEDEFRLRSGIQPAFKRIQHLVIDFKWYRWWPSPWISCGSMTFHGTHFIILPRQRQMGNMPLVAAALFRSPATRRYEV